MLDGAAHDFLGFAFGIALRTVEEVDTGVEGGFEACEGVFVTDMAAIREPAAERDGRDLETRFTDEAVLHFWEVFGGFGLRHGGE